MSKQKAVALVAKKLQQVKDLLEEIKEIAIKEKIDVTFDAMGYPGTSSVYGDPNGFLKEFAESLEDDVDEYKGRWVSSSELC